MSSAPSIRQAIVTRTGVTGSLGESLRASPFSKRAWRSWYRACRSVGVDSARCAASTGSAGRPTLFPRKATSGRCAAPQSPPIDRVPQSRHSIDHGLRLVLEDALLLFHAMRVNFPSILDHDSE